MKFQITFSPGALSNLRALRAYVRKAVLDAIHRVLSTTPTQVSKSRIKRLRGLDSPQYRLRVGGFGIFYDVDGEEVYVMRILSKSMVAGYLQEMGYEVEDDHGGATGHGDRESRD